MFISIVTRGKWHLACWNSITIKCCSDSNLEKHAVIMLSVIICWASEYWGALYVSCNLVFHLSNWQKVQFNTDFFKTFKGIYTQIKGFNYKIIKWIVLKREQVFNQRKPELCGVLNLMKVAREVFTGRTFAGEAWITKFK